MKKSELRIIFLDIDGPMIGTAQLLINPSASHNRAPMNTNAIGWLTSLCGAADAKIVTNSAHNYYTTVRGIRESNLQEDLVSHGLSKEFFHDDWRTKYYSPFYHDELIEDDFTNDRETGYREWLSRYEVNKYVIFDDLKFTNDPNLIHVTFEEGITYGKYLQALHLFDIRPTKL